VEIQEFPSRSRVGERFISSLKDRLCENIECFPGGGVGYVGFAWRRDNDLITMAYTESGHLAEPNTASLRRAEAIGEDLRRMPLYSISLLSRHGASSSSSLFRNMSDGQRKPRISVSLIAYDEGS
jgi:hypothetical protein